jgi:hypothetical protein
MIAALALTAALIVWAVILIASANETIDRATHVHADPAPEPLDEPDDLP